MIGAARSASPPSGFSPAAVALELGVLRWLTEPFGMPERAQGLPLSGGSAADLTAPVTVREIHAPEAAHLATIYVGAHAHASVRKAARIAGLTSEHIRVCSSTDGLRLDPSAVDVAVKQDLADGLRPIAIVGAAGTTNTGTLDPHRSLFLPFGTGALLVAERDHLAVAYAEDADHLRDRSLRERARTSTRCPVPVPSPPS